MRAGVSLDIKGTAGACQHFAIEKVAGLSPQAGNPKTAAVQFPDDHPLEFGRGTSVLWALFGKLTPNGQSSGWREVCSQPTGEYLS